MTAIEHQQSAPTPSSTEALEPGRPALMLGWLRGPTDRMWPVPIPVRLYVMISVPLAIGLGIWGFLRLPAQPAYNAWDAIFRAVKLYTLDLGPAAGGAASPQANWQLWVALILAALLVLRGLIALLRTHLQRWATRYRLRRHVIVCGGGVHGTSLVDALSSDHDVVLVELDPGALGMREPPGRYEWRLQGDGVSEETLLTAGACRAHWVVAVAGDDFVNSQIVSAMRRLARAGRARRGAQVFVQVEDPRLSRFLEEPGEEQEGSGLVVTPFSANAIAAEALIDESPVKHGARLLEMRDGRAPNILLAGDHPLIDALLLAVLRRWRVRVLRDFEANASYHRPPLHVSVFGPGAVERVEGLRRRWRPEPHVLSIEAKDEEPGGQASAEIDEWLHSRDRADHAIVVSTDEVNGIGLTLRISRALGNDVLMTRVTTELESVLDIHLEERTGASDQLASTEVKSIAVLACEPDKMKRLSAHDETLAKLYGRRRELEIRSDSAWRILPCERAMLEALTDDVPLSAVVRARLRINLGTPGNLRFAASKLSARAAGQQMHEAICAWCEYVRSASASAPGGLRASAYEVVADRILLLARAALGERDVLDDLEPDGTILADAARIAIFAGPAGSDHDGRRVVELLRLVKPALQAYDGTILSGGTAVGLPGVVGVAAREHGIPLVGYTPPNRAERRLYEQVRETPAELYAPGSAEPREFSIREPLAMWTDILRAGVQPGHIRVIAFRGGQITIEEVLLARALGAQVAWLDPAGDETAPLADTLPLGDAGVIQLPADPMTIRAFIAGSRLPAEDQELRERLAVNLHNAYRRKHRGRKPPDDPALAPWDELLETLKDSNRAAADDIPNKLALLELELVQGGERLELTDRQIEVLAEAEHGRWNVERLLAGWELGERHVVRGSSPDLKAWEELPDDARQYDREAVRSVGQALDEAGWGVGPRDSVARPG